ncbi:autotransporter outer membrane beta-barrel domain-containing protein, partial [Escherichia coli]
TDFRGKTSIFSHPVYLFLRKFSLQDFRSGSVFSGDTWKVTARAGLSYQFDLLANGETVLQDASGKKHFKGEKDSRMLMNVGTNVEVKDNMRFGLELEKSAFGRYNIDNSINANFRYYF